jgi:hypothetical protein
MRSTHRDAPSSSAPCKIGARRSQGRPSQGPLALVPGEAQAHRLREALRLAPAFLLVPVFALALVASGCGGAGSSSTNTAAPAAAQAHSTPRPVAAAPLRLSILSPRTGARTSSTLTVRVALRGASSGGRQFRYVLDRRLTRLGSARLTFHDLAPGHHRLDVFLANGGASRAAVAFTVRAPAPVAVPAPVQTVSTASESTPPPVSTANEVAPPQPPAARTAPSSPSPPRTTPAPPPSEGIPQGGGGDGDGDNSGGPSDGDGGI